MKLNNNDKIIYEEDIIMSDGKSNLSDIISTQRLRIDRLESNLKWIYKYGGVGSGSGGSGGSGGGGTQTFSIFAQLNKIQLKDQSIILNGVGLYPLNIKINNPKGSSFNVKYAYTTKSETGNDVYQEQTVILSIDNNYEFATKINLNTNSSLQITVSDGNETKLVMCNYVTTPYTFTLSLVDDKGNPVPEEHFIETAAKDGVNVKLTYLISIPADIHYKYTFLEEVVQADIPDKNNSILFPIKKNLFKPQFAGFYTAKLDLQVIPEGQEMISLNDSISFSLIPEDLYMLIQPQDGIIYDLQTSNHYEYTPGYLTFNYRVYEGISQNRNYNVEIKLNGISYAKQSVVERQQYTFKIFSVTAGENNIEIIVNRASTYRKTYYFYIQQSQLVLDWFENPSEWASYYYRISEVTDNFKSYLNKLYIEQTVNTPPIRIDAIKPPNVSANGLINTHIAIGLQYNSINGEDPIILNFYNAESGASPVLTLQQSQVVRSGQIAELYIRKQSQCDKDNIKNYHLILIYSQYLKKIGNEFYYEVSLYIDGILEKVFGQITSFPLLIDSLQIEPVNCYINLLEVDYKKTDEKLELAMPTNCDYDVYKFYLKYKSAILRQDVGNELLLTDYLKNFSVGLNGRVTTNQADINNIAKNIETPVMMMTYDDDGRFDSRGGFMAALEANYGEDGTIVGGDMSFQVTLSWSPGKNGVEQILFPSGFSNARFIMSLLGSSTKAYRVKNFTSKLENTTGTEQDDIYLYSPNFEEGNPMTFLPETEFTLKADVVDSSHSNNTSCGRFVNTVCKKFSDYMPEDNYYKGYIKNCLDGFPMLLFLCHVWNDPKSGVVNRDYYYLGVYNFNLGRSSYYNLGYKDLSVFGTASNKLLTNAGNSFTFFKITPSQDSLKDGLGVAEIQGGDPHFDFSQWDPTVLFQQSEQDPRYMFGDLVRGSNSTEQQLKNALSKFVEKVARSGGYIFDFLKKKKGPYETADIKHEGAGYNAEVYDEKGNPTGESKNQVPDYTTQYEKFLAPSGAWEFKAKTGTKIEGKLEDLRSLVVPDIDQGKKESLNFQAVSEYYTICMVLGLVDSVMKNLNMKSWDINPTNGEATWFPAFYDMDTCLGINNQGNPISYFAFSDYWHSQIKKTINNVEYPSAVRIYRDFSPHSLGENGYDVPTNYLFAIAKYAKLIYPDSDALLAVLDKFPQELYANWRNNTVDNKTHSGILKNADRFMLNFFANNLAAICPALVSYNYRSKYLKLANLGDTVWVSTDYNKFNGTRINKVRDWLEGRLHILDVYFGLNKLMPQAITYRTPEGEWKTLMQGSAPVTDVLYRGNYNLAENEDVVILRDIFSANGGSGVQLSGHVSFLIKCPEFSPLQIYNQIGSVHENFILGGDKNQQVEFTPTGVQSVKLGGSQAWSYLLDINWISTEGLYITTDKLLNITGNAGKFTSLQLHTPNVKTIQLNSRGYSGILELQGTLNYPNLSSINISGSLIGLRANNLNVKSINLANMNASAADVLILNCKELLTLNTTNLRLKSLTVGGLKGALKNFTLSNTNIGNIVIHGGEPGGIFTLTNDNTVTSVTVGDFLKVIISNCPKLRKVTLTSKTIQDIEELQIISCRADKLSVTSEPGYEEGKVTIASSKVKRLKMTESSGITDAELPDGITLLPWAFRDCINLKTVTGNNIYISLGCFQHCFPYKLKDKHQNYTGIKIAENTTSLTYTFYNTQITWAEVTHIINNIIPINNALIDVSFMFAYCNIAFGLKELKESYSQNNYPNFGKLKKVTNASHMLYRDGFAGELCAVNKKFMEMGSPNGCLYHNAFCSKASLANFYVPKDIFEGTILKVITPLFGTWNGGCNKITFTDSQGNPLPTSEEIKMSEIFNPGGQSPIKLTTLAAIQPYGDYVFDWTNTFTAAWMSLTSMNLVCGIPNGKYKGYSKLLLNVPNPVSIQESWGISALTNETADYYTMYNWDKQCTLSEIYKLDYARLQNSLCNNCKKYISADNYRLLVDKLLKSTTLTAISVMFRNTVVVGALGEWDFGSVVNPRITKALLAFEGFLNKTSLSSPTNFLKFSPTFFRTLPSLVNVLGMFRRCKFGSPIPFDMFNKRCELLNNDVYVLESPGNYKKAILYTYQYKHELYNMAYLFEGCEWGSDCLQYNPKLYNIKKNRVTDGHKEYSEYYTRTIIPPERPGSSETYIYLQHTLVQPTEITDAENLEGGYIAKIGTTSIINPIITGNVNSLIVPPDLFYGLKSLIEGEEFTQGVYKALACKSSLNGIIPKNLFKYNKTVKCNDLWKGQIIIPLKVKSWTSGDITTNVYVHFPSGYTKYPNLENAFNCECIVLEDTTIGTKTTINHSFVLLEDSIPKTVSSLSRAFEGKYRWGAFGFNLTTNTHEFNFFGKINGESVIQGFNPSHFTELNMNQMFYSPYLQVVNGNLFVMSFDAAYLKLSNKTDKIMWSTCTGGWNFDMLSATMMLPKATADISQFADINYKVRTSQIVEGADSKKYYTQAKWQVIE